MKARIMYTEGSSYFGGKNPYGENWRTVIEVDGKYYEIHDWRNHTNSEKTIKAIEFDPENMPEEYKKTEEDAKLAGAGTNYSLTHGNGEEIEIDLTGFDTEYYGEKIPEELREIYREELKSIVRKKIAESIKADPSLDYHSIIENANLTDDERKNAESIINIIEEELTKDKYLDLSVYRPIIENIDSISRGDSVIVTHKNASYSRPEDTLILMEDLQKDDFTTFATSGLHLDYAWGQRATKPNVFSLQGRKEGLEDGTSYLGSYWKQGYSIDMMLDKEGKPFINRNVYVNWANDQQYEGILDVNLPVDRFDIDTGEEGSFKEYNDKVHQKKSAKKEFYKGVIEQAKQQFGLSEKQVKSLLDFAGTVSALSLTTDFERNGLSTEQALEMLRKTSHQGMEKVLSEIGMEYPSYKFDVIQRAAETLAYVHTLQEEKEVVYTATQIGKEINPRQEEITSALEEIERATKSPELEGNTKTDNSNPDRDKR